eukprot:1158744-Pelagomonas_calceolata.AAC.12
MSTSCNAAYVAFLQLTFKHNKTAVRDMSWLAIYATDGEGETTLELMYNVAERLDMIAPNSYSNRKLLSVLDCCSTFMGHRLFKKRLFHPSPAYSIA